MKGGVFMHRQPLIGISGSMNTEENQYHINRDYVRSLTEAGAIPLLLAPDMTDEQVRRRTGRPATVGGQ